MLLNLPPELEIKLARIATERGCDAEALAREAIERFLDYDAWLLQEVNKGLAAADCGDFIEHDEVRKLIDSRYPG